MACNASAEFYDYETVEVLAAYMGWEMEVLPAYNHDEPPLFTLHQTEGPLGCAFTSLSGVMKFLIEERWHE